MVKMTIVTEEGSIEKILENGTALEKMCLSRGIVYFIDGVLVAPPRLTVPDILDKDVIGVGKPFRNGGAPLSHLLHYFT